MRNPTDRRWSEDERCDLLQIRRNELSWTLGASWKDHDRRSFGRFEIVEGDATLDRCVRALSGSVKGLPRTGLIGSQGSPQEERAIERRADSGLSRSRSRNQPSESGNIGGSGRLARRRWASASFAGAVLVAFTIGLFAAGCASRVGPLVVEPDPESLGPYPENYEQIVREWVQDRFDRSSRFQGIRITKPVPGFANGPWPTKIDFVHGYTSQVSFWPTNVFGHHVGRVTYDVLIRDSKVVHASRPSSP